MGSVVLIKPYARSREETIKALEDLLAEARADPQRLIGLAYVALYWGNDYAVGAAGQARACPTFTRGMLHLLDDQLSKLIGM